MSLSINSIVVPYGDERPSPCWFCTPRTEREKVTPKNCKVASLHAVCLSSEVYEKMLYRGWARSGKYCYKPDLKKSCCPQYPLRLDALTFQPSQSQRKVLRRWNRHIMYGSANGVIASCLPRTKGDAGGPFDLAGAIHEPEAEHVVGLTAAHQLEVTLEPPSYTEEKFLLYQAYLTQVHGEVVWSPHSFESHLVVTPFREIEPIAYPSDPPAHLPKNYGTYHQLYRVDGALVAMAVLDVLPSGVVSVYFIYDIAWKDYGLGKLSALREAALVKEMNCAGVVGMRYLYLGYYEHKCQKMRYKGEYSPSYLADPETYQWYPLEDCIPLLDKYRYACFSEPSHSIAGDPPAGVESLLHLPLPKDSLVPEYLQAIPDMKNPVPVTMRDAGGLFESESYREDLRAVVSGLGEELAKSIFYITAPQIY